MDQATQRCIAAAGGLTKLAAMMGIRHQSLYSWKRIPAERVLDLERLTGISRHELRGDLYPRDEAGAA